MAPDPQGGDDAGVTMPVLQEELQVAARTVEQVLAHDEFEVRHVPVGRVVAPDEAPATRQEGDTTIIPVLEEVLVLEKRVRIREEIHIVRHRRAERHAETAVLRSESVTVTPFDDRPAADRH